MAAVIALLALEHAEAVIVGLLRAALGAQHDGVFFVDHDISPIMRRRLSKDN
jgi:hypothetical protein